MFKSKLKSSVMAVLFASVVSFGATANLGTAQAETYNVDKQGAHAFITFKISHLGYSWIQGRFNSFDGQFEFEEGKPEASEISITVDTASLDSNHAERDKHLRSADFFDVANFPTATFVSKSVTPTEGSKAILEGDLTIKGVTKPISMEVTHIGGGNDPWGGVRQGFEGSVVIPVADYGMMDMGPASQEVEIYIQFEGIQAKS